MGQKKLLTRLEDSAFHHRNAFVAARRRQPSQPVALASETPKSRKTLKLCTFWVSPSARRVGVGRLLLEHRVSDWLAREISSVHVTVRVSEAKPLTILFGQYGFRETLVDVGRYGPGGDDLVLVWKPD
ncbi:MAG: GNAT family N-acetyltransferase, partial [Propionibacteriaceae bacterium]|nr:GNAT family N-acetyltransferase [Propionibacteriaceae bacterium]